MLMLNKMDAIENIEKQYLNELSEGKEYPDFRSGDTIAVSVVVKKVIEREFRFLKAFVFLDQVKELIRTLLLEKFLTVRV